MTFKESARLETSFTGPPTSGEGVVGSVANPPWGGGGGGGGGCPFQGFHPVQLGHQQVEKEWSGALPTPLGGGGGRAPFRGSNLYKETSKSCTGDVLEFRG